MQAKIAMDVARDRAAAEKSMQAAIHGGQDPEGDLEGDYGDDAPVDWCATPSAALSPVSRNVLCPFPTGGRGVGLC